MPGNAAGASGTGTGSTANVYTPYNQPALDLSYNATLQPMLAASANGGAGTPAGLNYPGAQNAVNNNIVNNPGYGTMVGGGINAGQAGYDLYGRAATGSNDLSGLGGLTAGQAGSVINNPYNAQAIGGAQQGANYGQTAASDLSNLGSLTAQRGGSVTNNPFLDAGLAGAAQGANYGAGAAYNASALGNQLGYQAGQNPYFNQAMGGAQTGAGYGAQTAADATGAASGMFGAARGVLDSGFDPQSALYNRSRGAALDAANVGNSVAGLGSSPYGASVVGNTLGNFDINWQDRQLGRQTQASDTASRLNQSGLGLGTGASSLVASANAMPSNVYRGDQAQQAAIGQAGLNLGSGASDLAIRSSAAPSNLYRGEQGQVLNQLGQIANTTGGAGAAASSLAAGSGALPSNAYRGDVNQRLAELAQLTGGANTGYGGAQNVGGAGLQNLLSGTGAGYNAYNKAGTDTLSALNSLSNLGNNQYLLPQQTLNDIQSYLGLGQSASNISGQLGQMGQNQLGNQLSGFGSLASGIGGLFGAGSAGGGLGGLSSLLPLLML